MILAMVNNGLRDEFSRRVMALSSRPEIRSRFRVEYKRILEDKGGVGDQSRNECVGLHLSEWGDSSDLEATTMAEERNNGQEADEGQLRKWGGLHPEHQSPSGNEGGRQFIGPVVLPAMADSSSDISI